LIDKRRPPLKLWCAVEDCGHPLATTWYVDGRGELRCPTHGLVAQVLQGRGLVGATTDRDPADRRWT
jgi:hypothetical protein